MVKAANKMVDRLKLNPEKEKIYDSIIKSFDGPERQSDKVSRGNTVAQTSIKTACSMIARASVPLPTPISVYKSSPTVSKIKVCTLSSDCIKVVKNYKKLKII